VIEFFSLASARADFSRWNVVPSWTPQEAVALTLGKDPEVVNSETLRLHLKFSPFREEYSWRLELVQRALDVGDLAEPIRPAGFLRWARTVQLHYPHELELIAPVLNQIEEAQMQSSEELDNLKAKLSEAEAKIHRLIKPFEDLPPKSQASLLKLVLGMAIARFEYRTPPAQSGTAKLVSGLLKDLGLPLDEDTVREWLSLAARELEFTWDERITMPTTLPRSAKPKSD
jgi:hypothetical protein